MSSARLMFVSLMFSRRTLGPAAAASGSTGFHHRQTAIAWPIIIDFFSRSGSENVVPISCPENGLWFVYQLMARAIFWARFLGPKTGPFFGSRNQKKTIFVSGKAWVRSSIS